MFLRKPCHWIQKIRRDIFAEMGINTNLCVASSCFSVIWNFDRLRSFFKHLPKYSSLPEFQSIAEETSSSYQCRRCGFTASVINATTCPSLGSALTCKEPQQQHEFASSVSRVRRASAPSRVFLKVDLSPWKFTFLAGDHANIDSNRPEAPLEQGELKATTSVIDPLPIVSSQSPYMPVDQTSFNATAVDSHIDDIDDVDINDYAQQREVPESLCDVATATRSVWGKNLRQNKNLTHLSPLFSPQHPLFYLVSQQSSQWSTIPKNTTAPPWG